PCRTSGRASRGRDHDRSAARASTDRGTLEVVGSGGPMTNPFRTPGPRALLWALGLLLLARLPAVQGVGVFAVLRGPLGLVIAVGAVLVAVAPLGAPAGARLVGAAAGARSALLFAAAAAFLLLAGLHYTSQLRVSGDEPHYLIQAQSLWRDHDLDLRNNYEGEDWREDTPGPVAPHHRAPPRRGPPPPPAGRPPAAPAARPPRPVRDCPSCPLPSTRSAGGRRVSSSSR